MYLIEMPIQLGRIIIRSTNTNGEAEVLLGTELGILLEMSHFWGVFQTWHTATPRRSMGS